MAEEDKIVSFGPGCAVVSGVVLLLSGGALLLYALLAGEPPEPLQAAVGGESRSVVAVALLGLALLGLGWGLATLRPAAWLALMALHMIGALAGIAGMLYPLLVEVEGAAVYLTPATALMGAAVNVVALVYFWRGRALLQQRDGDLPLAAYFEEEQGGDRP